MKLVIDPDSIPFQSINREVEFPGVGKISNQVRNVETISYKFLGRNQESGPWMYLVKFPAGYHVPRHSHAADRLEYVVDGQIRFDERVLGTGGGTLINPRVH